MSQQNKSLYQFGPFLLDPAKRLLLRDGHPVRLSSKAFDILLALVHRGGQVVEKDELMQEVWSGAFVEEANLTVHISALRRVLGENGKDKYIETVPRRGYLFVAGVKEIKEASGTVSQHGAEDAVLEESNTQRILPGLSEKAAHAPGIGEQKELAIGNLEPTVDEAIDRRPESRPLKGWVGPHQIVVLVALILAFTSIAITFFLYRTRKPSASLQSMKINLLTNNGKVYGAAISPDGKNVVYSQTENGQSSLWLKHLPTGSDVQIVPPGKEDYDALTFSKDGDYIYFLRGGDFREALYKILLFGGGAAQKLIEDINSYFTFSPDGKRLAFIRRNRNQGECALMVANADGTDERKLAIRRMPDIFVNPAWSPDGKTIACTAGSPEGEIEGHHYSYNVVEVRVADGMEKPLSSIWWRFIGQVAWLADGSGLLVIASERAEVQLQIWRLSYPGGEANRLTNNTNEYQELSLTADSNHLVAIQNERPFSIWTVVLDGNGSEPKQITAGATKSDGDLGVSWTPAGQIVYETNANQNFDLWVMNADGSNRKRLTTDPHADAMPSVSPDGHTIVFVSDRAGTRNIWRMNIDGTNQRRLSSGRSDNNPQCSPDGKWVVYTNRDSMKEVVLKIPIEGGEPIQLTDKESHQPAVSPDGKSIAFYYLDQSVKPEQWRIGIIPFEGGELVKTFDLPPAIDIWPYDSGIRWTLDGRTLIYVGHQADLSNFWGQPLDGSAPKQLTNFIADQMCSFDLSRDSKQLVMARTRESSDAVLISNFR